MKSKLGRLLTSRHHPLSLVPIFCNKPLDPLIILHQIQRLPMSLQRLYNTNSMRHLEIQSQQILHLPEQSDNLRIKVHSQLRTPTTKTDDLE